MIVSLLLSWQCSTIILPFFPVILLYGLEACPHNKSDRSSLDFMINRFLMKLLNIGSIDVVEDCKIFFGFQSPSVILAGRTVAFLKRYSATFNGVCQLSLFIGHTWQFLFGSRPSQYCVLILFCTVLFCLLACYADYQFWWNKSFSWSWLESTVSVWQNT